MAGVVTAIAQPPIFLIATDGGGDVTVFRSVDDAARFLEPVDVRNAEYEAYDARGRKLEATARAQNVQLRLDEDGRTHEAELAAHLNTFLRAVGAPTRNSPDNWEDFIDESAAAIRSWEGRG